MKTLFSDTGRCRTLIPERKDVHEVGLAFTQLCLRALFKPAHREVGVVGKKLFAWMEEAEVETGGS
jgi:hypothetical protein